MNDGVDFEVQVERWLRRQRGARFTERRVRQRGKIARHGHECDVHATMVSPLWVLPLITAVASILGCLAMAVSGGDQTLAIVPGVLGVLSVALLAVFFADPRHVWIECKSGEGSIKRDVVWKLVGQVDDVRRFAGQGGGAWYPSEVWLVARGAFDVDALAFAREAGVRCFVQQSGDIREVV